MGISPHTLQFVPHLLATALLLQVHTFTSMLITVFKFCSLHTATIWMATNSHPHWSGFQKNRIDSDLCSLCKEPHYEYSIHHLTYFNWKDRIELTKKPLISDILTIFALTSHICHFKTYFHATASNFDHFWHLKLSDSDHADCVARSQWRSYWQVVDVMLLYLADWTIFRC